MTQPISPPPEVNQRFSPQDIDVMRAYGEVRFHEAGAILVQEGDKEIDCCVVVSGQLNLYALVNTERRRLGWLEPGQFVGDSALLTGRTTMIVAQMEIAGEVLHIPRANFQRLLARESALSDAFVRAIMARQSWIRSSGRASATLIGSGLSRECFALRDLLQRHSVPFVWIDSDTQPEMLEALISQGLRADDLPVLFAGMNLRLKRPSLQQVVEAFGLDLLPDGAKVDVAVVGAGPGGLAAAVYAASEGLSVLAVDCAGPGGQAGTSSKIENYLGFPAGVSGRELTERATLQAEKFGARIAGPALASALERMGSHYCLALEDGRKISARAIVIATGMQYRRLALENLEPFEGRGVYYGATPMEAQLCRDGIAVIVGAGNSAGQGAVFLSGFAREVHVLFRKASLRETMSEYLVARLEALPNVILHPETEIFALHGAGQGRLSAITLNSPSGPAHLEASFVFLFIGAVPGSDWLPDTLAKDEAGFVKTGASLSPRDLVRAGWDLERMPSLFETSWPRVYAIADVRSGSVKRVASAVGEGSVCVQFIHQALAEVPG